MRSSVIIGGSPRRLLLHAGKWVLEVVRPVDLGQNLIRPTTQRLTGQNAITSYFESNPDNAQLGSATRRLMQTELAGETRTYTAEGVDWIASSTPPPRGDGLDDYRPPTETPALEARVSELVRRAVALTAVQEGLLMRLARLEAKLARGGLVPQGRGPAGAQRRRADLPDASSAKDPLDAPKPLDSNLDSAANANAEGGRQRRARAVLPDAAGEQDRQEGVQVDAIPGSAAQQDPAPPEEPASPPRNLLTLPPVSELAKCMVQLIGGDATAKEGVPPLGVDRAAVNCYAAAIIDDNGQSVGMMLMDLKATIFLGGTLIMLPRAELDQQLESLTPGEDSIAASAEICNALSGTINGFQDQHVRVGGLEKFELDAWPWVMKPADRRDLEDSFGGRTALFTRPPPAAIG